MTDRNELLGAQVGYQIPNVRPVGRDHGPHITFAGRKNVWSTVIGKSILVSRKVVGKKLLVPLDRTIQEASF